MDKKAKKRLEVLRKKIEHLQQQLNGAKQQMDDPQEVRKLEAAIAAALAEITSLKDSERTETQLRRTPSAFARSLTVVNR